MQPIRNCGVVLTILALVSPIFAQQRVKSLPRSKPKAVSSSTKTAEQGLQTAPTPDPRAEKERFETAVAAMNPAEKAELLIKFRTDFPKSELRERAEESLAGARAAIADERLSAGDLPGAVGLFKVVVEDAPKPYSDRLFSNVIATIPANLWVRGHRVESLELARLIESHVASDTNKLLLLSTFYLGSENGAEAKRIAQAALALDADSSAAHQALAAASRLNFDLEAAAASFARAIELDPESTVSKRSLGDMKRALGRADEAEAIYRAILSVNDKDAQARTGMILALFDQGKITDAEAELVNALQGAPGNVVLLAGAAYWYAANKNGDKAVELARQAVEKEPRYVWSHIALGRGLMLQGKPVEAEQALINARKYGNFPTLQYEIASARFAAGFFREAVEELKRSFAVDNGMVRTRLGGRVETSADDFASALENERRASIFAPKSADNSEDSSRMKALFEMSQGIARQTTDVASIVSAAEVFAGGSDNMAVHRKLYAANLLLQNELAADEAMKLASEATLGLEKSLDVPNAGAAVMANELYDARNVSFARDDFLLIPDVPRQTLNALMRGRIEDTTGLALLKQGKAQEASVRFRRALTVLPKDSAWWRSATWNLGTSLAAEGKEKEALDTMISSYVIDKPNIARYILIEQLWTKLNGSREGLEQKIGPNPLPDFSASVIPQPTPGSQQQETVPPSSLEDVKANTVPSPSPTTSPDTKAETSATPSVKSEIETQASERSPASVEADKPIPTPEVSTSSVAFPTPVVSPSPAPTITPEPSPLPSLTPVDKSVAKASEAAPSAANRSLFEPIIISIPRASAERATAADPTKPENANATDKETESAALVEEKDTPVASDPTRPRIVEGKAITGELLPCEIGVSQESISLINNGGSIAVLVSIEEGEDIELVTPAVSSPTDVAVRKENDLARNTGRAMFVISSISERTGLFQVTFKAPCGKKLVNVRVR